MGIRDVEDGNFTRIHNEIIEQLALRKFTVYEHQCLWFLFRKTYGYGQKEDAISLSQWVKGTGIKKQNIAVVLNKLVERRVINRTKARGRGRVSIYGFNKYFETWDTPHPEKVCPDIPIEKVCLGIPISEEKVCVDIPEKVCVDIPTKERKKVVAAAAAGIVRDPYVAAYEHVWGRLVSSPYEGERLHEWAGRVPLEAWQYALTESAKANAKNWKYLEAILVRVERDGFTPANGSATTTVNFTMEGII